MRSCASGLVWYADRPRTVAAGTIATAMTATHGFDLLREADIPELRTHARLFQHGKTGAELLSL